MRDGIVRSKAGKRGGTRCSRGLWETCGGSSHFTSLSMHFATLKKKDRGHLGSSVR